jgi:hypothetical protein
MSKAGHTTLTMVTVSTIPIHVSIVVLVSPWIYQAIDKLCRAFSWNVTSSVWGGQCLVSWTKVMLPVDMGGLGVIDLTTMGYALRLH